MNRLPGFLRRKKGAKGQVVKPPSPKKQQQKDDAYVDEDGGHSDVRYGGHGQLLYAHFITTKPRRA
jgi:hypothetical protein